MTDTLKRLSTQTYPRGRNCFIDQFDPSIARIVCIVDGDSQTVGTIFNQEWHKTYKWHAVRKSNFEGIPDTKEEFKTRAQAIRWILE